MTKDWSRDIREFKAVKQHPILIKYRKSFNVPWYETPFLPQQKRKQKGERNSEARQRGNLSGE